MKNIETEVKYRINKLPNFLPKPLNIRQIYFDINKVSNLVSEVFPSIDLSIISTFRVRRIEYEDIKYILTLKTKAIGYTRGEFEKEISEDLFNKINKDNVLSEIIKNRYVISKDGFNFEIDEYLNLKTQLFTCEVEVDNINDNVLKNIERVLKNDFMVDYLNVSDDVRYRNSNLIKYFGVKND